MPRTTPLQFTDAYAPITPSVNATAPLAIVKSPRKRANRKEALIVGKAREIMDLIHRDATNPKTKPLVRATLARSYAVLGDAIRVWRGIPSPGQLRPDLDPVQMAKALSRARKRNGVLDVQSHAAMFETPDEAPKPNAKPTPDPDATKQSKESLSPPGPVPTGPPPGEAETGTGA